MYLEQGQRRGAVARGEAGADIFNVAGGTFATVTGGAGADLLRTPAYREDGFPTRVVFTDFADGVRVRYRIGEDVRKTSDLVAALDRNGDDRISRADSLSGAAEHEAFAFSRD